MFGTNLFGIGVPELMFIAILALIILGPQRLPGAMRELANFARQMRALGSELTSQFSEELEMLDELNPKKIMEEVTRPLEADTAKAKSSVNAGKNASKKSTTAKKLPTSSKASSSKMKTSESVTSIAKKKPDKSDTDDSQTDAAQKDEKPTANSKSALGEENTEAPAEVVKPLTAQEIMARAAPKKGGAAARVAAKASPEAASVAVAEAPAAIDENAEEEIVEYSIAPPEMLAKSSTAEKEEHEVDQKERVVALDEKAVLSDGEEA